MKKFPSLAGELDGLEEVLLVHPQTGTDIGSGIFKIRLASKSKGAGKSGGFRVITYLVRPAEEGVDIYLITIYDKSEESTIDKALLKKLVKSIFANKPQSSRH
ncbi:MAG: addiction module toxin RelE [Candidatus Paceibacterales bacterium]